jgi:isoquinoline 1-oxidoreductase alpha subunit
METLNINGRVMTVDAPQDMPLLGSVLSMTGTKFGCGVALCGASTIHLDGTAVRSSLPALSVRFSPDHFIRSMS